MEKLVSWCDVSIYLWFFFLILLYNFNINFPRYYYADADDTRKEIREFIKKSELNSDRCSDMKQKLLNKLNIQEKSEQELLKKRLDYIINIQNEQGAILKKINSSDMRDEGMS